MKDCIMLFRCIFSEIVILYVITILLYTSLVTLLLLPHSIALVGDGETSWNTWTLMYDVLIYIANIYGM